MSIKFKGSLRYTQLTDTKQKTTKYIRRNVNALRCDDTKAENTGLPDPGPRTVVVIVVTGTLRDWLSSVSWLVWGYELCKVNQTDHVEAKEESVWGVSN